jgi:hypothetical protein
MAPRARHALRLADESSRSVLRGPCLARAFVPLPSSPVKDPRVRLPSVRVCLSDTAKCNGQAARPHSLRALVAFWR